MHRTLAHRLATAAVLAAWLAPAAIGLAIGLHLHLHHGAPPQEWALAVGHGHSHAVAEAEHEHTATRAEMPRALVDPLTAGVTGEAPPACASTGSPAAAWRSPPLRPPRRGLYTLHCTLLR